MRETNCVCNKCGKHMDDFDINMGFSFEKDMGYGSKYDGEKIKLNLCCECVDNIIDILAISPIIK